MPLKDKDLRKAYAKTWASNNKDKTKIASRKHLETHPEKRLLHSAKRNAFTRGLSFELLKEDLIIPTHCPYLGMELSHKIQGTNTPETISLDRIDNSKGYIKGNVQVISNLANKMKSSSTEEQLVLFAKNVLRIHDKN